MKVVHVVDSMEVGGAETLVAQMCRLQRDNGHDPQIYAVAKLGALGERLRGEGFRVEAEVGKHLVDSSLGFLRLFRRFRPDVVHLHNPTPTIYAAPAARLSGVGAVISTRHSLVAPPRNAVMERKYAIAARFCDWVVGICDATVNNVRDAGSAPAHKLVRIYNGTVAVRAESADQWPAKSGFTLLFVGRLEQVKNLPLLLEAVRVAVRKDGSIRLWVVGDGTQRAALEQLSRDLGLQSNVTFWGQQLDVARFFSAADVFVMSSVSEGLPMSLLQAFSIGLPAIVTDVGGLGEVVRLAEGGVTVPTQDVQALSDAILNVAKDTAARERFSKNAEQAFRERFTLQQMMAAYTKLYESTPRARAKQANR